MVLTVPYYASPRHNHKAILNSIDKLHDYLDGKNIYVVVPMTYADSS
jgi:hypothetical protein